MSATSVCAHPLGDFSSCQYCGRPTCTECHPLSLLLTTLSASLPLRLCATCRAAVLAVDAAARAPDDSVATAAANAGARLVLRRARFWGDGARVTSTARAALVTVSLPVTAACGAALGLVQGLFVGAAGGALGGALGGGVAAFDLGNRVSGTAGSAEKATPAATASAAPGAANAPKVDVMARAKAILALDAAAQAEDATAEAARVCASGVTAYDVLRVARDANASTIARAHKAAAMAYHPDRNAAPEATKVVQAVNAAAALLLDPERRAAYDADGCASTEDKVVGGPDLKIKSSAFARGAGAAGTVMGGLVGLGVGAAGGVVMGAVSGAISAGRAASRMAGTTQTATETVCQRVRAPDATSPAPLDARMIGTRLAVRVPNKVAAALRGISLPPLTPARAPDVPQMSDSTFAPSPLFLARLRKCCANEEDAVFSVKLAEALAAFAAAERKDMGAPDPPAWDGDAPPADANDGDATGLSGGDTYDAAAERRLATARAGGPITSGAGLVGHLWGAASERAAAEVSKESVLEGFTLAMMHEIVSRGVSELPPSWEFRRRCALEGGARAASLAEANIEPIVDADSGWDSSAPPRAPPPPRARLFVEVAAHAPAAPHQKASGWFGRSSAAPAKELAWVRVGAFDDGEAGAEDGKTVERAFTLSDTSATHVRLVVDVEGGGAGGGADTPFPVAVSLCSGP